MSKLNDTIKKNVENHESRIQELEEAFEKMLDFITSHPLLQEDAKKVFIDVIEDIKSPTLQNVIKTGEDIYNTMKDIKK
jgi:F0F1-type ATP synthase delta subunit